VDWILPSDNAASDALRAVVDGDPLVADILARRGIVDPDEARAFLDPAEYRPSPAEDIPDLAQAAQILHNAIRQEKRILVWGDFDVDGQTSTALLVSALQGLKAHVQFHIPHRLVHGHGVQADVLQTYFQDGIELVLTCDTGISEHAAADAARAAGVTLVITDHHALPPDLPNAPAVVNPQRLPQGHPLRDLPGVGVSFMLARYLYALAGRADEADDFLDLVALGIVSDMATQRLDTRYLLQRGIERLRYPRRVGLIALMQSAGVDPTMMSSDTIGFQIGPRLNALGRLDDARMAVDLLTTSDETDARQIAAQLETLNSRRRQIEDQIYAAAQEQIARDPSLLGFDALVLGGPTWHSGVIGIVAARLVEQFHKPTILLVIPEKGVARGSARSVPGVDIGAAIAACGKLLISHGGHPGAAGLSLDTDLIPQFRRQLSNIVKEQRDPSAAPAGRSVDAVVRLGQMGLGLAQDLNRLSPFGAGNPPNALMAANLRVVTEAVFRGGKHRKLTVEDDHGVQQTLTWWRGSEHPVPAGAFDLLFTPRINDYRGKISLQLEWLDSRPIPGAVVDARPRYEIIDQRGQPADLSVMDDENYLIWAEADVTGLADYHAKVINRASDQTAPTLVIWTTPPGAQELAQMLAQTGARRVLVISRHADLDTPAAFLERLFGLVKYAQKTYGGEASVIKLASATAQREATVRRGLEWLAAKGRFGLAWLENDRANFSANAAPDPAAIEPLQDALRALLAETAAFRAYFQQADLNALFQF